MRGEDRARVPADHPLRAIRAVVDEALEVLSPEFERLYSKVGRPSIAPDMPGRQCGPVGLEELDQPAGADVRFPDRTPVKITITVRRRSMRRCRPMPSSTGRPTARPSPWPRSSLTCRRVFSPRTVASRRHGRAGSSTAARGRRHWRGNRRAAALRR